MHTLTNQVWQPSARIYKWQVVIILENEPQLLQVFTYCFPVQAKSRKKVNSSTLKHLEKLFTPIPATSLSNALHTGYAEVLALGSWQRYWCVVHSGALYLYQNHESPFTTLTIILKGMGDSLLQITIIQRKGTSNHISIGKLYSFCLCQETH